jgi:glycosyltransferase involved in cell wall biosynthesis
MAAADAVLTLSPTMAREIAARGVPEDRIVVVPQAVDPMLLSAPVSDPARTRAALGIAPDATVVGTVTSVVPYEGLDRLVRAAGVLVGRGAPLHLLIVGDGTALPALRDQVRAAGLEARVTLTGRVPRQRVPELIDAMDAFAVPRRDDPVCRLVTPMKPLEAMARAVPVLASDLPALADLVREGISGLRVPADDTAWAHALERVVEDPVLMQALGIAARSEVAATRTWQANADLFARVYADVTGGAHVGAR